METSKENIPISMLILNYSSPNNININYTNIKFTFPQNIL